MCNDLETREELGQLVQVNDTSKNSMMSHAVYNRQFSHLFIMHIDSIDVYFGCFLFLFREKLMATVYLYVVKAEYFTLKLQM